MDSGEMVVNDGATLYYVDPSDGHLTFLAVTPNVGNDLAGMPTLPTAAGPSNPVVRALDAPMNPFAPGSRIQFRIEAPQDVRIAIYDLAGRLVRELAGGAWEAGTHRTNWDGRDVTGKTVASGTYFLQLTGSAGVEDSRKISLVR